MKHLSTLLLITLFFVSCSSDDDNSSSSSSDGYFNPPSWIQGTWMSDESVVDYGFIFTDNNFIQIAGASETNYNELFNMQPSTDVNVNEDKSDSGYTVRIVIEGSINIYKFNKLSETSIEVNLGGVKTTLNKQ